MTPLTLATPPEDGRRRNRPKRKITLFIDAAVAELRKNPGQTRLLGRDIPKGRARPYEARGCQITMRNTTARTADIYVAWPKED